MTNALDDSLVDQIVAEVLAQLRQRIQSAPGPAPKRTPESQGNGIVADPIVEFSESVITEEILKQQAGLGAAVRIPPGAILTPSAQDYIRIQKLSVRREPSNGRVKGTSGGMIIAAHLTGIVQSFLADVKKHSKPLWNVETEAGTKNVVERTISVICRGESTQVLVLVKNPVQVACLVNRNPSCRAAVVQSGADVRRVRAEFGANVICADLQKPTFIGLRDVFRASGQTAGLVSEPEESRG